MSLDEGNSDGIDCLTFCQVCFFFISCVIPNRNGSLSEVDEQVPAEKFENKPGLTSQS